MKNIEILFLTVSGDLRTKERISDFHLSNEEYRMCWQSSWVMTRGSPQEYLSLLAVYSSIEKWNILDNLIIYFWNNLCESEQLSHLGDISFTEIQWK